MEYQYTPAYAKTLTIHAETGEDETTITRIDKEGVWVGDYIEEVLIEQHGDTYAAEIDAEIKAEYEADKAEFLWDQRQRRWAS